MISEAELALVEILGTLAVPPSCNLLLALLGFLLFPWSRRAAATTVAISMVSLYAFSIGFVANQLHRNLNEYPILSPDVDLSKAEAIVVLAGGASAIYSYEDSLTASGPTIANGPTMERLLYAVSLHKHTDLPLLVTGNPQETQLMLQSLKNTFSIDARFVEKHSHNTAENAAYSAAALTEAGITRIVLVTSTHHMPRAMDAFARQEIKVTPAPVIGQQGTPSWRLASFLPRADTLAYSASAIHEYVGRVWYRLRY